MPSLKDLKFIIAELTTLLMLLTVTPGLSASNIDKSSIKNLQIQLNQMGFESGFPDGVYGSKTLMAIESFYKNNGLNFGGELDLSVLSIVKSGHLISKKNYSKTKVKRYVNFDTGVPVDELTFLDAADVDNDGIDDIVVSGQVTDVGYDQGLSLQPIILLSNFGNFYALKLPKITKTTGSFSGSFFQVKGKNYFYFGHNGERHTDPKNPSKATLDPIPSLILAFDFNGMPSLFSKTKFATMSASIEKFEQAEKVYVIENNYNAFTKYPGSRSLSLIYDFSEIEPFTFKTMAPISISESKKPMNHVMPAFLDDNNFIDFIVATEKQRTGSQSNKLVPGNPSSYIVFNAFESQSIAPSKVYLNPPDFGELHSGFNVNYFSSAKGTYFITLASAKNNLTWQRDKPKFVGFSLTTYKFNDKELIGSYRLKTDLDNATFLKTYKINIDEEEVLLLGRYTTSPLYVYSSEGVPKINKLRNLKITKKSGSKIVIPLKDRGNGCYRFLSTMENPNKRKHMGIISDCKFPIQ